MAYAYLGRMYGDIGESLLSAEATGKAYELRDRTSDREKFFIAASYDVQVTGNLERAQHTCELWAQTYPREMLPHALLAGLITNPQGTTKGQSTNPGKSSGSIPTLRLGMTSWPIVTNP